MFADKKRNLLYVVSIAIFGVIATILLIHTHAQTPTASFEAENGAVSSCASKMTADSASAGGFVEFGTCAPPTSFTHPGILLGTAELNFVKAKIAAGAQPWASAFAKMEANKLSSLSYTPTVSSTLPHMPNDTDPGIEVDDIAAYDDALIYYYTGNTAYADKSIAIMNAWSGPAGLKAIGSNAQLDAAWAGEVFPRAAEIIRYTYTPAAGHTPLNVTAFSNMLTNVLLPQFDPNSSLVEFTNGNIVLSMADATMNIGVFTNNRAIFNQGVSLWQGRLPAYLYETADGATPVAPPGGKFPSAAYVTCFWATGGGYSNTCTVPAGFAFHDGQAQETCRDTSHTIFGLDAATFGAATASLQGVNLYTQTINGVTNEKRLSDAYEFASKYDMQADSDTKDGGKTGTVPSDICGGVLTINGLGSGYSLGFEAAYDTLSTRLGISMPYTEQMTSSLRPTNAGLHLDWETLTLYGTP